MTNKILTHKIQNHIKVQEYITIDPRICHGKPCFRGTRIMVYLILELLEAGVPVAKIIGPHYYPQLTRKHILEAHTFRIWE